MFNVCVFFFFFSSRRRHTRYIGDWSSDVCSSDLQRLRDQRKVLPHLRLGGKFRHADQSSNAQPGRGEIDLAVGQAVDVDDRSEERRVGKEWRCRWWRWYEKEKR